MEARPVDEAVSVRLWSFLVIAIGIGIGAGFAAFDATRHAGLSFVAGMRWFGYTLAALYSLPVLGWMLSGLAGAWGAWDALQARQEADDEPLPPASPLLGGGLDAMTDAERHVQAGLLLTLAHGRRAGGLTHEKIGYAFGKTQHWVWWTAVLAASGLAVKVNGEPTVLPPGKTYFWAISKVRRGEFECPDPLPPTLPPLPVAVEADGAETAKLGMV